MSTIKKWLTPPQFEDEDDNRRASFLHYLLLITIALLTVLLIAQAVAGLVTWQSNILRVLGTLIIILFGLEIALHQGYVKIASYTFVISGWVAVNFLAWNATGIHDTGYLANIVIILLAGLLLGWRMAIIFSALAIAFGWILAYAEAENIINFTLSSGYNIAIDSTAIFALVAVILGITIGSLENAIKRVRASEETLADANDELQKAQESLETRVAEQTRDLTLAAEIGQAISQIRDLDELLTTAVERIRSRFDLYYAQIYLVNEDGTQLDLSAGTGTVGEYLLKQGLQLNVDTRSINGQAVLEKRPIIVSDTAQSTLFRPNPSLPYTRSEMSIPLIAGNNVLGVIDLQSTTVDSLNEGNLSAFEALAGQLAITLQNASLFREQERLTQELQENTQQFQENSNFLDAVIDNLPTRLFVKDAKDLRYLRWNKAGAELLGIPTEDVIGKTDLELFPDMAHFYMEEDRKILKKGVLYDVPEEIAPTPQGTRILHTLNVPILDEEGKPLFLLGISEDITEQKEIEHMLSERVKELNLLNEIGQKTDEQPSLEEFLTYIANRIPSGMQHEELCKVAITVNDKVYGASEAINLPSQIVEGLSLEGTQIGRIYIAYTEKQTFINEESALIGSIGRRVTDYIANRRLLDRVQATVEGLQTVAEVGTAITSQQDTQHLLQNVVELTKTQFDFYHAHIYLYDEMIDALVLSAGAGEIGRQMVNESRQIPLSAPQSLVARSARERQGLVVANVKADPSFLPHPLLPETRSEMAVPLAVGEQLIGVMDIQSSIENGFSPEDINIQTTLASQIAVALQNAEQYEETQAALDEVNALQRALTREGWQAYMTAVNRPTQGFQISQNEINPILNEDTAPTNGNDENNSIAYPLSVRGTAIGKIGVSTERKNLSEDDLELLESISDQVAEALERARLFEETELARSQTEALFTGSENVVSSTSLNEILTALVKATALQKMDRATLIFFDKPWQDTSPESFSVAATWLHEGQEPLVTIGTSYSLTHFPSDNVLDRNSLIVIDDIANDPRVPETTKALFVQGLRAHTAITIPLVAGDQWIGYVLGLCSTEFHINANEQRQIISLVGQAATVAQSQRLYEQAQARAQREQILREVSARVSSAVDAESVLQTATREIGRALGLETFVYLKDPTKKHKQDLNITHNGEENGR